MKNIKIIAKIMIIVGALSAVTIFSAGYSSLRMKSIDDLYNALLDNECKGAVSAKDAQHALALIIGDSYRMVAETDAAEMKMIQADMDKTGKEFKEYLDDIVKRLPQEKEKINKIETEYDGLTAIAATAATNAQNNNDAEALSILRTQFHQPAKQLSSDLDTFSDEMIKMTDDKSEAASASTLNTIYITGGLSMALLVMGFGFAVYIGTKVIARPIGEVCGEMKQLADGNTSITVSHTERKDEIGMIAQVLKYFQEVLIKNKQMAEAEKLEQERKIQRQQRVDTLIQNFDAQASQAVSTVASASTELSQTAKDMTSIAHSANEQSASASSASVETSSSVQSVAAAVEEMSATIQEISKQVSTTSSISKDATQKAQTAQGNAHQLLEASRSIMEVTGLIEDIASQVNLLALNATIESARAGDAGKGFAVVANEVKQLAGQTSKATENIRHQLDTMHKIAETSANSVQDVVGAIQKINEAAASIASAIEEQSATTRDISSNMHNAAKGVEVVTQNIVSIKSSTESTASATQQVLSASNMLSTQAEQLNTQVRGFLDSIKTA